MRATLTISLSRDIVEALKANKSITIRLGSYGARAAGGNGTVRSGSLPARAIEWAKEHGRPFGTRDIVRKLHVSRAHASMILGRLANGPYPVARRSRGVYEYSG